MALVFAVWLASVPSAIFFVKIPVLVPSCTTLNLVLCVSLKSGWELGIGHQLYAHSVDILLTVSAWVAYRAWMNALPSNIEYSGSLLSR